MVSYYMYVRRHLLEIVIRYRKQEALEETPSHRISVHPIDTFLRSLPSAIAFTGSTSSHIHSHSRSFNNTLLKAYSSTSAVLKSRMFKSILLTSVVAALASVVSADGPGRDELVARQPYTNAEAFARGLPPLRPRHGRGCKFACAQFGRYRIVA